MCCTSVSAPTAAVEKDRGPRACDPGSCQTLNMTTTFCECDVKRISVSRPDSVALTLPLT